MNDARAVVGMDRLPWLTDEPLPASARANNGARGLLGGAFAALLLVAGASYWVGTRVAQQPADTFPPPEATVKLPDVRESQPQLPVIETPEAKPEAVADRTIEKRSHRMRRAPVRGRKVLSPMETSNSEIAAIVAEQQSKAAQPAAKPAPLASRGQQRLWPATESKGASGRIVRIGAFGTREQAKLGWRRMQRAYPAVGHLPATVVTDRNSRGRYFYRFQIGTTSQAHSEVLCQRMQKLLRFSCAVVGLPWKAKVER